MPFRAVERTRNFRAHRYSYGRRRGFNYWITLLTPLNLPVPGRSHPYIFTI